MIRNHAHKSKLSVFTNLLSKKSLTKPYTFMSSLINGFNQFSRPESEHYAGAYDKLVQSYGTHAVDSHNVYKLMARLDAETHKLRIKSQSHNSDSLQRVIQRKEAEMGKLQEFAKQARESYFSVGQVIQGQVDAYLELFGT